MYDAWRSKVERDLGGVAFERALVTQLDGGLRIAPLYEAGGPSQWLGRSGEVALAAMALAGHEAPLPTNELPAKELLANERRWSLRGEASTTNAGEPGDIAEASSASGTALHEGGAGLAHALDVHDRGGSAVLEIAVALARWLEALRAGHDTALAVAVGSEVFVEAAKLRALRSLAGRAGRAIGRSGDRVRILARTSLVGFSRIEPETNALRTTLSVLAAMLGGAEVVAAAPYDLLCPLEGSAHARAARLASTTGLVASLEAHLTSVEDPLHGAYFVEALTRELTEASWGIVRELERRGGIAAAEDHWRDLLARDARTRHERVVTGRLPRVGATRLARADAPMLGPVHPWLAHVVRDAAPFEALRDEHVARATTILVVGDAKKTAPRADYLRETLSTWGAPTQRALLADPSAALSSLQGTLEDAVVVCAEDATFAQLPALVRALRARGAVAVAGKPGAHEAALREAGAHTFVHLGVELPACARAFYGTPETGPETAPAAVDTATKAGEA